MQSLTTEQAIQVSESILFFVFLGVSFFAVSMVVMIVIFGYTINKAPNDIGKIALLLMISLSLPFVVNAITSRGLSRVLVDAKEPIKVSNVLVEKIDAASYLISFNTNIPTLLYLEVAEVNSKVVIPIMPTYTFEKRTDHFFIIQDMSVGSEARIIVNGKRYLVENKPILLD